MLKVILIDDEPLMLEDLQNIIDWNSAGFEIAAALSSVQELIERMKYMDFDLVISDIVMPGMTGIEMCEFIRKKRDVPVILLSAYSDFEYARRAVRASAFEYLTKPVDKDELLDTLHRVGESIREKKQQQRNMVNGMINELISEPLSSERIIAEVTNAVSRNGAGGDFCVASIRSKTQIDSAAAAECFAAKEVFITPIGNMRYICLFVLSKHSNMLEKSIAEYAGQHDCCIGVSGNFHTLNHLVAAIEQAGMMSEPLFCGDKKGMFVYKKHDIKPLLSKIKAEENTEKIREMIQEIPKLVAEKRVNPDEMCEIYLAFLNKFAPENTSEDITGYKYLTDSFKNISDVVDDLLRFSEDEKNNESVPTKKIIREMVDYISKNYNRKIYLSQLAEKYYFHPKYLSMIFKNEVGKTFIEYLVEVRLNKAEELLANENLYINKIGEMVGYDDYFHFCKLFKKYHGVSPSKYRASLRAKASEKDIKT